MYLLIIFSLALSSNLDNIGVGLAYGIRKTRPPFLSNLIIAVITSCGTLITMILGKDMAVHYLNGTLANYLGSGIIILVGIYIIIQSFWWQPPASPVAFMQETDPQASGTRSVPLSWLRELVRLTRDPELVDRDCSGCIETGEAMILGLALHGDIPRRDVPPCLERGGRLLSEVKS